MILKTLYKDGVVTAIGNGSNEIKRVAKERLGSSQFIMLEEGRWTHGESGDSVAHFYGLTHQALEMFNEIGEQERLKETKNDSRFYVFRKGGNAPERIHTSYESASDEATRLSELFRGSTFEVLSVVESVTNELPPFKWIKDRLPTMADEDEKGYIAYPHPPSDDGFSFSLVDFWLIKAGLPWSPTSETKQFTKDNPAPLPFDQ
ncbi:hypothetical protein OAI07_01205 [Akkermansiaceae bacterium]|nr:hypothetical protein [Akkermansiaceae bacterium]